MLHIFLWGALSALFISSSIFASASADARTRSDVFATRITPENAERLIRSGPDAIGGINDWFFTNGTLCAIISDPAHEGEFSENGGSLVDLGFCNRADDFFSFTYDLLDGSRRQPINNYAIRIEQGDEAVSLIVNGRQTGAEMETRYTLSKQLPTQVKIHKRLTATKDADFSFYSSLNFNYHSLEAFVLNSADLSKSNGFKHEDFVSRGTSAIRKAARPADTIVTLSPPDADQGIAYAWKLDSAERIVNDDRTSLPSFVLADDSSNALLVLADDFYIGDGSSLGWIQLPQIPLLSVEEGVVLEAKETIYVGPRGDVASVTDQVFVDTQDTLHIVSGRINEPNSAIHIYSEDGVPVTHSRPNAEGSFTLKLPTGKYSAVAYGSANRETKSEFQVPLKQELMLTLPTASQLALPRGQAMRLIFLGVEGTTNPNFADRLTRFSVRDDDGETYIKPVNSVFLAGTDSDPRYVDLAPGAYQVIATRGPEYSLGKTKITLTPGSKVPLNIALPEHVAATPGFIASDLHVHSGYSFDNAFAERERVRSFAAEAGEVMVSSEHDIPVDYRPLITQMGLDDAIAAIPAAEATSLLPTKLNPYTNGHANIFPLQPNPHAHRRGMIPHENKRWREVLHHIRRDHPEALVQLNHPRYNLELSGERLPSDWQDIVDNGQFLDHMGSAAHPYNPHKPLHTHPNSSLIEAHPEHGTRDINFDLIEVMNPSDTDNAARIKAVRLDWLSFVLQGIPMVGTANSDSHRASEQVAVPRTMVKLTNDNVAKFDQNEFLLALKSGKAYGTSGPFLQLDLAGTSMGGVAAVQRANLRVRVHRAPWVTVSRLAIQINGVTVDEHTLNDALEQIVTVPLSFEKDSLVTVEVFGDASEDYKKVYPGLDPYAFSNPIYVDFDDDGKWTPPGLP